eukprot:8222142-Pyramimonas_sp.AAC.1
MLPIGRRFLHDTLPHRVRYPDAIGEVRFSAMPPAGVGPIMLRRLARFAVLLESWARNWGPSLFLEPVTCSGFDDWMFWGTKFSSRVFPIWAFCGLFATPEGTVQERRILGSSMCHAAWH